MQTGLLASVVYVPAVAVALLRARGSDRRSERVLHSAAGALLSALGTVIAINGDGLTVTLIGTIMLAAGIYASLNLMWQLPIGHLVPGAVTAVGVAITTTLGNLASFSRPYIVGWLHDGSGNYDSGLYFVAAALSSHAPRSPCSPTVSPPARTPDTVYCWQRGLPNVFHVPDMATHAAHQPCEQPTAPRGITWMEVGGEEEDMVHWVDDEARNLPLTYNGERPGLYAVAIDTPRGHRDPAARGHALARTHRRCESQAPIR
ncbi:MFS transporter [Streptomyces sp. PRh5]|uniref:MFS transporter n=1 Tax=Streptomyces sp. PRh5 TaxID=1158056 RepID=UPI0004B06AD2|nr:MFS transporter [Streptomyces sp. PRh5]